MKVRSIDLHAIIDLRHIGQSVHPNIRQVYAIAFKVYSSLSNTPPGWILCHQVIHISGEENKREDKQIKPTELCMSHDSMQ